MGASEELTHKRKKPNVKVLRARQADENHQVVSVVTDQSSYMKKPCADCPWRKDAVGEFPAEAFRISAPTSYDMSRDVFSCHTSGCEQPKACAGFLLNGAYHSMAIRLGRIRGLYQDVQDGGHELFDSYKAMAIANGVDPDDECLLLSRDD